MRIEDFILDPRPLGQGGFGQVFAATWLSRNMRVAVKVLYSDETTFHRQHVEEFQREISLHYNIRSPHVVLVYGCIVDETTMPKPTYAIVMELMASSVYSKFVKKGAAKAELGLQLRVLHQLAVGLVHLHADDIIHLDIKSLNAMLDNEGNAKWTDFGLRCVAIASTCASTIHIFLPMQFASNYSRSRNA
jgi:serine/threonine protein kinase